MKKIYLIRHGEPDTGYKQEKVCLGRKDVPLTEAGEQAIERLCGFFLREEKREAYRENISVIWSSPLKRCLKTAEILLSGTGLPVSIETVEQLTEIHTGIWDGLPFREIKASYPEDFRQRGEQIGRWRIPGGETFLEAGERFLNCLESLLPQMEGDAVVVAHAGVIRAFLCRITGKDINELMDWSVPYGSITEVIWDVKDQKTEWKVSYVGMLPVETMDQQVVEDIWKQCGTTEEQQDHMICTAEFALDQIRDIPLFSTTEKRILFYSCLLHDMLRSLGRGHEHAAAEWLEKRGYAELVNPVGNHNNAAVYQADTPLSIEEVVYYSDKRVRDAEIVSLEDRFSASQKRIRDEVGRQKHKERMLAAIAIGQKIRDGRQNALPSLADICLWMTQM